MDMRARNSGGSNEVSPHSNQGSPARYSGSCGFCSVDQSSRDRRQEPVVEDIAGRRPFAKFEILRDLVDRAVQARRVDAAEAVALDLVRQDVVDEHAAQAFPLEVAVAV